jgi:hypothetical protein
MLCSLGLCIGYRVDTVTGGSCAHSTMVIIRDGLIRRPSSIGSRIRDGEPRRLLPQRAVAGSFQVEHGIFACLVGSFRSRARR